jgi:transposase-like protein
MRKSYTPTFKAQVVRELPKEELTIAQLAAKYAVHPTQLHQWNATALKGLPSLFIDDHKAVETIKAAHEQQLTDLYAEIGKLTTQLAWLKKKGFDLDEA